MQKVVKNANPSLDVALEKISQEEIQARIDEMPKQCAWVVIDGGTGLSQVYGDYMYVE